MARKQDHRRYFDEILIKSRSENQQQYLTSIVENDITLCAGPAGTGKTFLAVAKALKIFRDGDCDRIVMSRPVVECGESLGYLPGTPDQKVHPYMMPLYDSIYRFLTVEQLITLRKDKCLEICPLAYTRGRTFNNTVMILDEAQNADLRQLLMFLTRIGKKSKVIVCGDPMQVDFRFSGLKFCIDSLTGMDHTGIITLDTSDIVRHELIAQIVQRIQSAITRSNGNGKHLASTGLLG